MAPILHGWTRPILAGLGVAAVVYAYQKERELCRLALWIMQQDSVLTDGSPLVCALGMGSCVALWESILDGHGHFVPALSHVALLTLDPITGHWSPPLWPSLVIYGIFVGSVGLHHFAEPKVNRACMRSVLAKSPTAALGDWSSDDRLAICIPDHTRPMDVPSALLAVSNRLEQVPKVVVGLGLHRPMTPQELQSIQQWNPIQHDPDDVVFVGSSGTVDGLISREVCEADSALILGLVELHQYAGLSSGYKGIVVGCGGRDTIRSLHSREMVLSDGVCVGLLSGNPFRMHIDAIGAQSNARWALLYVPLQLWGFGEPKALIEAIASRLQPWTWT